jgi:putative oxidoreductase
MLGLLTRPAALASALTMLVALFWVHWGQGFFMDSHGIEYALALSAAAWSLMVMGGGSYSLDNYLMSNNLLGKKDE